MPPISSIEETKSKSVILSNCPTPVKFKEFVIASKATLVFVPWNLGTSWSSLLVWINFASKLSGKSKITLASPALNLPPSSWNFKIYSPSRYGTSAVVVLPESAWIKSVALEKDPVPSVFEECLTYTRPPWVTSKSVAKFQRNLTNFSLIGSAVRPDTSVGTAVFPIVVKVSLASVALASKAAFKLRTDTS